MRITCTGAGDLDGYALGEPYVVAHDSLGGHRTWITRPGASDRFLKWVSTKPKLLDRDPDIRKLVNMYERGLE